MLVFLEITYNDSLQQCVGFITGKIHEKVFGAQLWAKGAKLRSKTRFFCHFLQFSLLVYLEIAYNDSLQQYITSCRGKTHREKKFGKKFRPKCAKIWPKKQVVKSSHPKAEKFRKNEGAQKCQSSHRICNQMF